MRTRRIPQCRGAGPVKLRILASIAALIHEWPMHPDNIVVIDLLWRSKRPNPPSATAELVIGAIEVGRTRRRRATRRRHVLVPRDIRRDGPIRTRVIRVTAIRGPRRCRVGRRLGRRRIPVARLRRHSTRRTAPRGEEVAGSQGQSHQRENERD